jgi:hypothetical protein
MSDLIFKFDEWMTTSSKADLFPITYSIEEHYNFEENKRYFLVYLTVLEEKIHQSEKYTETFVKAEEYAKKMIIKFFNDFKTSIDKITK